MTLINGNDTTFDKYVDGWTEMMVDIWQDQVRKLDIRDTGALYNSISAVGVVHQGELVSITHEFNEYGVYVDAGVGNGYRRDNGGDLGFSPNRVPKPWFNKKYFASFLALRDAAAEIIGKEVANNLVINLQTK